MGTIRFVLRTDKPSKDGYYPVDLIYQLSGQRKYYRTNEKLKSENWNSENQQVVYIDKKKAKILLPNIDYNLLPAVKEVEEINSNLALLKKDISDIERLFELKKIQYSTSMVIDLLKQNKSITTKRDAPKNQVIDFIEQYIIDHKQTRLKTSLAIYNSLKAHLIAFRDKTKIPITFDGIDYSFMQAFQNFLLSIIKVKKDGTKYNSLNNATIAKQLSTLKTFLNYAKRQGLKVSDMHKDFKIKRESLEVIALTNDEFEALYNMDLSKNNKLDQVRDVFCFACATGLRYSDLSQLKREHIKKDEIRLVVTKTKEQILIPLNPYSHSILQKYSTMHRPLPVISNQKTNEYIHELCRKAGINDPIEIVRFRGAKRETTVYNKYELTSIHTGRKTFCTLSLEKGMSAEEVMKIGGWKDYRSFSRYVKITEQRTKTVMRNAWGEIKATKLKAV